jgi:hypothetical protein
VEGGSSKHQATAIAVHKDQGYKCKLLLFGYYVSRNER